MVLTGTRIVALLQI